MPEACEFDIRRSPAPHPASRALAFAEDPVLRESRPVGLCHSALKPQANERHYCQHRKGNEMSRNARSKMISECSRRPQQRTSDPTIAPLGVLWNFGCRHSTPVCGFTECLGLATKEEPSAHGWFCHPYEGTRSRASLEVNPKFCLTQLEVTHRCYQTDTQLIHDGEHTTIPACQFELTKRESPAKRYSQDFGNAP